VQPQLNVPTLYRGSVKDLRGPVRLGADEGLIFDYTDAYSVFDWGRMPDGIEGKGEALAVLAAEFFEQVSRPQAWREFSASPEALALRKANRFGAAFNELGEELQETGLKTHFRSLLEAEGVKLRQTPLAELRSPTRLLFVRQVHAVRPVFHPVLGCSVPDYQPTLRAPLPRLVPLEVVFRFSCPPGSSILERIAADPKYLSSIGFGHLRPPEDPPVVHETWSFPVLELFTKLEPSDRPLGLVEALAISGIPAHSFQELLFRSAWLAGFLRGTLARAGLELADGKFEWAVDSDGELLLVDAIGPDELRLLKDGVQISKEFLRTHYRRTAWFERINAAKQAAKDQGSSEWKRLVGEGPPPLPEQERELAVQLYLALANQLASVMSRRTWFPQAWSLDRVVGELKARSSQP
jgi:phosphoribosylaminoimidazole-succinocarboxamide synthase